MERKKRKPILAAILSIVTPGLGQVYNGQLLKGIVFFYIPLLVLSLLALMGLKYHFYGMLVLLSFAVGAYLFIIGEAFFVARKKKEILLKSYNKWFSYLLFAIVAVGINMATEDILGIDPFGGIKAYKILSGAMIPTLLIGDRIIVNLKYYTDHKPGRGDIIVFKYPEDPSREFIKRVIATENDIIESKDKTIYINGTAITEPYVHHTDTEIKMNDKRDNFGPLTVQKDKFFVMGDNRDQSYDSRYWGYVDKSQLRGKVLYFYWSKQTDKIGKEVK